MESKNPVVEAMKLEFDDVRIQFTKRHEFWASLNTDLKQSRNFSKWKCTSDDIPLPILKDIIETSLLSNVNPLKRNHRVS